MTKPKTNGKKSASAKQKATQFKKGNKLGGRTKGSRNKLGEAFLKDFLDVWSDKKNGGKQALIKVQKEDPAAFIRAAVAILPKELNINHDISEVEALLDQFDIEQLDELVVGLATLGAKQSGKKEKDQATARSKSDSVH